MAEPQNDTSGSPSSVLDEYASAHQWQNSARKRNRDERSSTGSRSAGSDAYMPKEPRLQRESPPSAASADVRYIDDSSSESSTDQSMASSSSKDSEERSIASNVAEPSGSTPGSDYKSNAQKYCLHVTKTIETTQGTDHAIKKDVCECTSDFLKCYTTSYDGLHLFFAEDSDECFSELGITIAPLEPGGINNIVCPECGERLAGRETGGAKTKGDLGIPVALLFVCIGCFTPFCQSCRENKKPLRIEGDSFCDYRVRHDVNNKTVKVCHGGKHIENPHKDAGLIDAKRNWRSARGGDGWRRDQVVGSLSPADSDDAARDAPAPVLFVG